MIEDKRARYLVAYDYGQGAVWALVYAVSVSELEHEFPELTIVAERPKWMTDAEFERIGEAHTYDIHDRAVGLLAEII